MGGFFTHTLLSAGHEVKPDQFEPGVPDEGQAHQHLLDMQAMSLNLSVSYGYLPGCNIEFQLPVRITSVDANFLDANQKQLIDFNSIHHRTETISGIGDALIGLRGRVFQRASNASRTMANVRIAVTLPTGDIKPDPFELGRHGAVHGRDR